MGLFTRKWKIFFNSLVADSNLNLTNKEKEYLKRFIKHFNIKDKPGLIKELHLEIRRVAHLFGGQGGDEREVEKLVKDRTSTETELLKKLKQS
ncbi:hypothetical protein KY363_03525 [Candidatus Woesearchaeota archaeon]|nr:hypothetical protein [Candidatus Woesearchaeota archaeon]